MTATYPKPHPLDNITPKEIVAAKEIIKNDKNFGIDVFPFQWDFISMANYEPPKEILLPLLRQGDAANYGPIERKSLVVVQQKRSSTCARFIVNQSNRRVDAFIKANKNEKASISLDEVANAETYSKQNKTVRERMAREYGIKEEDFDTKVLGDVWSLGYNGPTDQDADYNNKKMINVYYYFRLKDGENQQPHCVGFISLVDMAEQKVVRISDLPINNDFSYNQNNLEIPKRSCNYSPEFLPPSYFRTDIKPYVVTQPNGPSFKINGNRVHWLKWQFRVTFNYRTGLTLHYITHEDKHSGTLFGDDAFKGKGQNISREVMYQLGLSEMVVPYADPRPPYYRKAAFDIGEFGLGFLVDTLTTNVDCLGDETTNSVQYMDFSYCDQEGNPITIKRAVCIHEEDAGISHKHTEYRNGKAYLVRSRRLVVGCISSLANYVYLFYYYFYLDGTIEFEVKATGRLITSLLGRGIDPGGSDTGHGTRVFPLGKYSIVYFIQPVNAHYHQHIFCARMDFLVDGKENAVAMNDIVPLDGDVGSSTNPYGNGFTVKKTGFRRAKESVTDINAEKSRFWEIFNPNKKNKITNTPVAWRLIPNSGSFQRILAKKSSFVTKRAGFVTNSVWVTPFNDNELYASGFYVVQSHGDEGLPVWVSRNEDIYNKDIVLWHTFGFTHLPRCEDFPIMPVEYLGYLIKPFNAFESNPALDVPPGKCSSMRQGHFNDEFQETCDKCWWGSRRSISSITCAHREKFETT